MVRIYRDAGCTGTPIATGSAAQLDSPGIAVEVALGATATFSATATDVASNTSACSAPISYTRVKIWGGGGGPNPTPPCIVPKLTGKPLGWAKAALKTAGCKLGTVRKPKKPKGKGRRALVVKSSSPPAGARSASGYVNLTLGPKPRKTRH
jgi:hypothetical protein